MPPDDLPPGLVWYPSDRPGIRRARRGRGFSYLAPDGTRIDDAGERTRIEKLAVPPAYEDVWISPRVRGHLQATGLDVKARRQYRYHPDWTAARAEKKWHLLPAFGRALPEVRAWIESGLKAPAGSQDLAVALALRLIDRASMRVGGDSESARGAVTLKRRDAKVEGRHVTLDWIAKGGRKTHKELDDRRLARALHRIGDLPGGRLATWTGPDGEQRFLRSEAVNERLAILAGEGMTAKTFRTWNGSLAAFEAAMNDAAPTIGAMADAAAARLHNTPAIARTSYVHPAVLALSEAPHAGDWRGGPRGLDGAERRLVVLTEAWAEAARSAPERA